MYYIQLQGNYISASYFSTFVQEVTPLYILTPK